MPRKTEKCLCHDEKIKKYSIVRGNKRAHCPEKGHFCSTYKTPYTGISRKSFAEQVNTVTERHMMPKIADNLLKGNAFSDTLRDRTFIEAVKRFSEADRTCSWWDRIWPWSEFNRSAVDLSRKSYPYAMKLQQQLNEKSHIKISRNSIRGRS